MGNIRRVDGKITKEYRAWKAMKARCYSFCNRNHGKYRENNIQVCDSWKNSFEEFYKDLGKCPEGYSLDRIDNKGNYEASNCRWADINTQSNNRSEFNLVYTYNNESKTLKQWSKELNIKYTTLYMRIVRSNMSFEEAIISTKLTLYKGELKTIKEWSNILNMPYQTIIDRRYEGWSIERALETPVRKTKI